jgi:hypothetical protein
VALFRYGTHQTLFNQGGAMSEHKRKIDEIEKTLIRSVENSACCERDVAEEIYTLFFDEYDKIKALEDENKKLREIVEKAFKKIEGALKYKTVYTMNPHLSVIANVAIETIEYAIEEALKELVQ